MTVGRSPCERGAQKPKLCLLKSISVSFLFVPIKFSHTNCLSLQEGLHLRLADRAFTTQSPLCYIFMLMSGPGALIKGQNKKCAIDLAEQDCLACP